MRIGVVQTLNAPPDMTAALRAGSGTPAGRQGGAGRLVVFPELFLGGYFVDQAMVRRASEARASLARLQAAVDQLNVSCVVGVPDLARRGALRRGRHPAPPARARAATPRRTSSAPRRSCSPRARRSGRARSPAGSAGWMVCYEIAFPEVARSLALSGARLSDRAGGVRQEPPADLADRDRLARHRERLLRWRPPPTPAGNGVTEFAGHSRVIDPPERSWPTPATAPRCSSSSCANASSTRSGRGAPTATPASPTGGPSSTAP